MLESATYKRSMRMNDVLVAAAGILIVLFVVSMNQPIQTDEPYPTLVLPDHRPTDFAITGKLHVPGLGDVKLVSHAEEHEDIWLVRMATVRGGNSGRFDCDNGKAIYVFRIAGTDSYTFHVINTISMREITGFVTTNPTYILQSLLRQNCDISNPHGLAIAG